MRISARSFLSGTLVGFFLLFIFWVSQFQFTAQADTNHIVISQVQIAGAGSDNASQTFIELYNPTETAIDLAGWRLADEQMDGSTTSANLVASLSGSIISHGYFLVASPSYTGSVAADLVYSASSSAITSDNAIILYSDAGITTVDEVGMGQSTDKETAAVSNPPPGGSVLRKASQSSTAVTLMSDGSEEHAGNGWDTDNNFTDFVVLATSMPRNSQSSQALVITPIPTDTPTMTPEPSVTLTPTPFATDTPTPMFTPTPTVTLTDTPVPTVTPTPTEIPTNTPTATLTVTSTPTEVITPIPTETPVPTVTSTPTVTVTPTPHMGFFTCTWKIKTLSFGFFQISFPILFCR